jgi:hypothetical protein
MDDDELEGSGRGLLGVLPPYLHGRIEDNFKVSPLQQPALLFALRSVSRRLFLRSKQYCLKEKVGHMSLFSKRN